MTTLSENLKNRVEKLPKPSNSAQALQPLFEAISNSKYAIFDRFETEAIEKGEIRIKIENLKKPQSIAIIVSDNGFGLDPDRFQAFCTVDTDFKKSKGGKGVGRLFWLSAFNKISVQSKYGDGEKDERSFDFVLSNQDQIREKPGDAEMPAVRGTSVAFRGLSDGDYSHYFPKRADTFLKFFSSHFISDFLIGGSPKISLDIDGEVFEYPKSVSDLVVVAGEEVSWESERFGRLSFHGFLCQSEASAGLEGRHQVHLLADGRTVETRKIDGLIGIGAIVAAGSDDLCLHVCVDSPYLNERVNEGRTAFTVQESVIKDLLREISEKVKSTIIQAQINQYKIKRSQNYLEFIQRYPIFDFDDPETQLDRIPFGANDPEEFAAGLVKIQIRREEDRYKKIQAIVDQVDEQAIKNGDFSKTIIKVAEDIQKSEELSLAQHVVRRKLILELIEILLRRYRVVGESEDHYLEKTLHSVLCPTQVSSADPTKLEARRHDLWVVDERLAFSRAFSSDKRLDSVLADNSSGLRPDLIVWDIAYGMAQTEIDGESADPDVSRPITEMLVVELKKPMRESYKKAEDNIEQQILKYIRQLKGGEIETFSRDRVQIKDDCIFHCFVVADIVGDLKDQISGWAKTPDGLGRYRPIEGDHRGYINVVQWNDLINDAWLRNQAALNAAGLRRSPKLITAMQRKLSDEAPTPTLDPQPKPA